uniref:Uncharacterized protein n=1 Tax=Oryza brachyantha TaxID=4533 RepID=J3MD92_ORYBR
MGGCRRGRQCRLLTRGKPTAAQHVAPWHLDQTFEKFTATHGPPHRGGTHRPAPALPLLTELAVASSPVAPTHTFHRLLAMSAYRSLPLRIVFRV